MCMGLMSNRKNTLVLYNSVRLASSISNDSLACPGLLFLCKKVLAVRGWPSLRDNCLSAPSWAIKAATLSWGWESGPAPCSSARGLRQTVSRSPGLPLFKGTFLSPRLNADNGDSGAAQGEEVAAGVVGSWVFWLWSWLRDFFDARLNSMPTRLLLSRASGGRAFPTKEENAVVTCWRTSSCLKRSEGDRRREKTRKTVAEGRSVDCHGTSNCVSTALSTIISDLTNLIQVLNENHKCHHPCYPI